MPRPADTRDTPFERVIDGARNRAERARHMAALFHQVELATIAIVRRIHAVAQRLQRLHDRGGQDAQESAAIGREMAALRAAQEKLAEAMRQLDPTWLDLGTSGDAKPLP